MTGTVSRPQAPVETGDIRVEGDLTALLNYPAASCGDSRFHELLTLPEVEAGNET